MKTRWSLKHGKAASRRGDGLGSCNLDALPPRIISLRQERREKAIRDALSGAADRAKKDQVTLPKFSWDN